MEQFRQYKGFTLGCITESVGSDISLSSKQIEILKLLATGITDKALSLKLGISVGTVKYHKGHIFETLASCCSTEAVVKAIKLKIISLDEINLNICSR